MKIRNTDLGYIWRRSSPANIEDGYTSKLGAFLLSEDGIKHSQTTIPLAEKFDTVIVYLRRPKGKQIVHSASVWNPIPQMIPRHALYEVLTKFCSEQDLYKHLQGTVTEDFEWASATLLSLCDARAIQLLRKYRYDTLAIAGRNDPGGADILAMISERIVLVDCTQGPLKDNVEKLVNVVMELEQQFGQTNSIKMLPMIITSKYVSGGELQKANQSGIVVLDQTLLKEILAGISNSTASQILNGIISTQLKRKLSANNCRMKCKARRSPVSKAVRVPDTKPFGCSIKWIENA